MSDGDRNCLKSRVRVLFPDLRAPRHAYRWMTNHVIFPGRSEPVAPRPMNDGSASSGAPRRSR